MDIASTLEPNSDQLDAVELIGGPRTFTVAKVTKGDPEQPVQVHLADFPRPWRPGKSMRRVLAACWGTEASAWVGRRVTLYCDESVRFGSEAVGGTRIRALSHIDGVKSVPLLVSRGKSARYTVEPLPDSPPPVSVETLADLQATLTRKGIPEDKWLAGANHYSGGNATALDVLTEDQARKVLEEISGRPDVDPVPATAVAEPYEPTQDEIDALAAEMDPSR